MLKWRIRVKMVSASVARAPWRFGVDFSLTFVNLLIGQMIFLSNGGSRFAPSAFIDLTVLIFVFWALLPFLNAALFKVLMSRSLLNRDG